MENYNRLQVLHCEHLFNNIDEIKKYVEIQQYGEVPALYGEPIVFKYADGITSTSANPNIVLAIGSVGNGTKSIKNKTFFIDSAKLENGLNEISAATTQKTDDLEKLKELFNELRKDSITGLTDSNTISFSQITSTESGKTYSANVKICEQESNIITKGDGDGIYAKADLFYDKSTNTLTFENTDHKVDIPLVQNQFFVSGYYQSSTDEIVLEFNGTAGYSEIRIPVRGLIEEWGVDNTGHSIKLTKTEGIGTVTDQLSADLNIAKVDHNILHTTEDGASVYVEGTSDKIYFDINNSVYQKITALTENDRLEAERAKNAESALGISIHAEQDRASQKENEISGKVLSVSDRVATVSSSTVNNTQSIQGEITRATQVENQITSTLNLEIQRSENSESSITSTINNEIVRAKGIEDTLSGQIKSNFDSVNNLENSLNTEVVLRKDGDTTLEGKIITEATRATAAEVQISTNLTTEVTRAENAERLLSGAISSNKSLIDTVTTNLNSSIESANTNFETKVDAVRKMTDLTNEVNTEEERAKTAEQTISGNILTETVQRISGDILLQNQITRNTVTILDTDTIDLTETVTDSGTVIKGDVKVADVPSTNIIKKGESGLYADPASITYDALTNKLTFTNENGIITTYTLAGTQVMSSSTYLESSRELRLIFANGSSVDIPLSGLVEEWNTSGTDTVDLQKVYNSTIGKDVLSALVKISSNPKNTITTSGNGLFVSNDSKNYIFQDGSDNGISVQSALTSLNGRMTSAATDLTNLKTNAITGINADNSATVLLGITELNGAVTLKSEVVISQYSANSIEGKSDGLYVSNNAKDLTFTGDVTVKAAIESALTSNLDTARIKIIEGQTANTYTPILNCEYISAATNMTDADSKLNAAIVSIEGNIETNKLTDGRYIDISGDHSVNFVLPIGSGTGSGSIISNCVDVSDHNIAAGSYSSSEGKGTQSTNEGEKAIGTYNVSTAGDESSSKTIFSVGIGTSDTDRKNALDIRKDGLIYINTYTDETKTTMETTLLQDKLNIIDCGEF